MYKMFIYHDDIRDTFDEYVLYGCNMEKINVSLCMNCIFVCLSYSNVCNCYFRKMKMGVMKR